MNLEACEQIKQTGKVSAFYHRATPGFSKHSQKCTCGAFYVPQLRCFAFWATGCNAVRPTLSDRYLCVCLSVLSCLSVTLVYCGQTVGWIKMKFGTEVGLGYCHVVLDGHSYPPQTGAQAAPSILGIPVLAKRLHGSRCYFIWR